MPGPNDRSNRRSRYSPSIIPGTIPTDDEHPFLTPNGYRIMRDRDRMMNSVPVAFPEYPAFDPYSNGGQVPSTDFYSGQQIAGLVPTGTFDEFGNQIYLPSPQSGNPVYVDGVPVNPAPESQWLAEPVLQNILPSKKFPDPLVLGNMPMTSHYESSLVADPQATALRAIGKLLIQVTADDSREPATGSAWIAGPSLIVTSAHNLYEFSTGNWSVAAEFHPGFDYYSRKDLPKCRVTSCCIPKGYMQNPTTNDDIAVCFVDTNIGDIVGAEIPMRPVDSNELFNISPVTIVGYPAGSGFDFGKQMWRSRGDYLFGRSNGPGDDYSPVMATDFGGGSSGCPWLIQDPKTNKLVSVGVTSAHAKLRYRKGEPNLMSLISPYFGPKLFDSLSHDHVVHHFSEA
ncbi:MAG: glutamyl endopeptidase [Pirellulaceae bacterium]